MFLEKYNSIFIHLGKTGGNSLQRILLNYSDDYIRLKQPRHDGVHGFDIKGKYTSGKHQTLQGYFNRLPREVYEKQKIVTILRHPIERLLSFYWAPHFREIRQPPNFLERNMLRFGINLPEHKFYKYIDMSFNLEEFKQLIATRKNNKTNFMVNGVFHMPDIIIDFADYENSANLAFKKLGLPKAKLPRINKTKTKQPKNELAQRPDIVKAVMETSFAEDFEAFSFMNWKV